MNASPLAAKFNPFLKKNITTAATTTSAQEAASKNEVEIKESLDKTLPDPVTENPVPNPFGKEATKNPFAHAHETKKEEVNVEPADEAVTTEATPEPEPETETVTEAVIETETTVEPEAVETADTIEETTETEVEAETDTETTEAAPKKRRRRTKQQIEEDNKAAAAAATASVQTESSDVSAVENSVENPVNVVNNSTVDFKTACEEFGSYCNDEEWTAFADDVKTSYNDIKITPDITTASLIGITCQLSNLRDKIWQQHQYYKAQFDRLASKEPEGVIERTKRLYMDDAANNDMKRKKSSTVACMNYTTKDGNVINLYEFLDEIRARYYFLNAVMNNIEFKKNQLVTISSALKIENSLAN